jgi:hypothetical protein
MVAKAARHGFGFVLMVVSISLWPLLDLPIAGGRITKVGGNAMEQRAGITTFMLPDGWLDTSIYTYFSPDRNFKITMFIDNEVQESTPEAIIRDRVDTAKDVLPGFKIHRPLENVQLAGREGKTITFDSEDADGKVRSRIAAAILAPGKAIIVNAQGPVNKWELYEPVWAMLVASFKIGEDKNVVSNAGNAK